MYDTSEFVYIIMYKNKTILKTRDIRKFNIYDSLLKEIESAEMEYSAEEFGRLASVIYNIYEEDVARIDPAYLCEQVFRLYLINDLEWLEMSNPKEVLLSIYDNEF